MFNNTLFGQSSLDEMKQQMEFQQMQYKKMQDAQQSQSGQNVMFEEFKGNINSLSADEQQVLVKTLEFSQAKQVYEAGFMDFLGTKFSSEYLSTPIGKQAIESLNEATKVSIRKIKDASKERTLKLEAMAELIDSDPEIQKRVQEKLNKKS